MSRRPRGRHEASGYRWWQPYLRNALFAGALVGGGLLLFLGYDYQRTRDVPPESGEVVQTYLTGRLVDCDRSRGSRADDDEEAALFRIADPRPGLPGTVEVRGCPGDYVVGETWPVARWGSGPDEVLVAPPTGSEVAIVPAAAGLAAALLVAAVQVLHDAVLFWWDGRRGRGAV